VGFGGRWRVHFIVDAMDEAGYRLRFTERFSFGVVVHAQIGCMAMDEGTCQVTHG